MQIPAPEEIHVWLHSLSISHGDRETLLALLDPSERERAARFRFETHRDAFIASHSWIRTLLGRYLHTDPRNIEFLFGKFGKPSIHGAPLQFNLSHSGAMAACAITRQREVGIDIEHIRPMPDLENIARHFFHTTECSQLLALDEAERVAAFFRCWTRKEAYVKALGTGLADSQPAPADWSVIEVDAGPHYVCAVAICGSHWRVSARHC